MDKIMSPKSPAMKGGFKYSGNMPKIKGQTATQYNPSSKKGK